MGDEGDAPEDESTEATWLDLAIEAARNLSDEGAVATLTVSGGAGPPTVLSFMDGETVGAGLPRSAVEAATICRRINSHVESLRDAASGMLLHAKSVVEHAAEIAARQHAMLGDGKKPS